MDDSGAIHRRLALGLAVLTASGLLALAAPGDAHAAPSNCSGRKVRSLSFSTGAVHVYKQQRGWICAVTLAKNPGRERWMSVSVQARGQRPATVDGKDTHRMGPVRVHAGHRSVKVKGRVGSGAVSTGWIRF
nr:hypothetical protein [Streptomyces dysideae]